jgi:hypothetical protein
MQRCCGDVFSSASSRFSKSSRSSRSPRSPGSRRGGDGVELRNARDERGERGRRSHDEHGESIAAPARFEIRLAKMEPVAARLHFARATQIGTVHMESLERIAAGHDLVIGKDGAELEREGVEGAAELVRGEDEWRREALVVPRLHARGARAQIVDRQRIDDGERVRDGVVWLMSSPVRPLRLVTAARIGMGAQAINDQRLQPAAEEAAEIALERGNRVGGEPVGIVHETHCIECGRCAFAS